MIDVAKKTGLIEHIKQCEGRGAREILLPPATYFDGYDDEQCIVCANSSAPISTAHFMARLQQIQAYPEVQAVFVRFADYLDALEDQSCWVNSDSVYLVTRASLDVVRNWFVDFEVSGVWEENELSAFFDLPAWPEGYRLVAVWWD
jgi:hypothetical protein